MILSLASINPNHWQVAVARLHNIPSSYFSPTPYSHWSPSRIQLSIYFHWPSCVYVGSSEATTTLYSQRERQKTGHLFHPCSGCTHGFCISQFPHHGTSSQTLPLACPPGSIHISLLVVPSTSSSHGLQALYSTQTNWSVLQTCSLCSKLKIGP